jgi:hypothetical protein
MINTPLIDATILTMLPGSRMQEVARMLPIFFRTVQHLSHTLNDLSLVIPVAPHWDVRTYVENVVRSVPFPVVLIPGGSLEKRYGAFNVSSLLFWVNSFNSPPPNSLFGYCHFRMLIFFTHLMDVKTEDISKHHTLLTNISCIVVCSKRIYTTVPLQLCCGYNPRLCLVKLALAFSSHLI